MLQRFKTKVFRRQASPGRSESASVSAQTTESTEPRTEKHGLFKLAESQPDPSEPETYPVDIIAVHGLNGDAYSTWTHSLTGTLWLRDFLPNFLPGCRVYTYGYPSKLFCELSRGRVQEFGRGLLASVRDHLEDSTTGTRPIIFVCHSLGGIVCKQALVFAHEDDNTYGAVLKSTIGVVFLATPHTGSDSANLASVFLTIVNTFKATTTVGWRPRAARTELLDYLSRNSDALQDLLVSVRHRLHNVSVVSFYETQAMAPLSFLIVDRASAQLGLSNEDPIPLYEDHRSICRFASETSSSYMAVAKALRRIVRQSPDVSLALRRASTPSSYRTLSDVERTCMTLLNDSDAAKYAELPPKPIPGTCQWIHSHHLFVSWLEKGSNALLWLTGNPGCGKTMLSYSLAQNFKEVRAQSRTVLIYLCQNKNKQTDGRAVLISLIFQIIERHRSMIRHVRRVFELQGSSMIQSFSSLWGIFLRIVRDPKAGSLYVILDALDECEEVSCHQLLESISDMLADSSHTMQSGTTVKFLITSRPFLHQSYANTKQTLQPQISIDDGQIGYADDLQKFIRERVDNISLNRQYSSEIREFLFQAMISKADRTFLWTHVVLASVEKSLLTSKKDFQSIIASIPEDLANTYKRYLSAIPSGHQDDASHLLKLLLASLRPLHLDELNIAFTMDPSHITTEDVARDTQNAIAHTVQGILGPLVRVSGSQVSLVHQSVKEFLLEQVAGKYGSFPAMRTVNAQSSALRLATVCIQYLLLDDFKNDRFSTNTSSAESDVQMPGLLDELPMGDFTRDFWDEEDYNLNSDALFREEGLDPEICLSLTSNYGFYSYASLHWAEHFAICEEFASDQLKNAARSLLDVTTGSCRNWLHFYRTQAVFSIDDSLVYENPIILAAQFNLHTMLKDLLGSCDHAQAIKNRSLYWAAQLGHDRIVASLLAEGAEPDSAELETQTALTTASEHGNLTCIVALLADERTNINIGGRRGRSALSFACGSGHDNIVKELLGRSSCNADDPDNSGATPFLWAIGGGHHSVISSLARHPNVDINHRDKTGRTAVSWAAGDGMDTTLEQLLKLPGINVNIKDNNGKSPLSWAAGNGCANAAEVLLQSTLVDINSIDNDKRNAISWASGGGNHDTLVKLLDKGCLGVDTEDIDGWTPLAWAIQTDSPKTVQALINNKSVQIERRDYGGRTALSWAVEYGHASIVKVLLQAGADPEAKSKRGSTPISIAEQLGRSDLLSELITHKS